MNYGEGSVLSVVVAEDSFLTAHLIVAALDNVGVSAEIARYGEQVVQLADEQAPPLLIINLNFSRPSGLELLRILRLRERGMKAIVLLNPGQSDMKAQASAYGATVFFENPFDPGSLADKVIDLLREA